MSSWWHSVLPVLFAMGAYLIRNGSQQEHDAAIRRNTTTTQVQRAIELEKSIARMRPKRWYDTALAIAIFVTPLCQWLGYQYSGSVIAIVLPLAVFLLLYVGINGFAPYIIPRAPVQLRKYIVWLGGCGGALAFITLAPSSPGIIATEVALLDLIGLLAAMTISSKIRSAGLRPAKS